MSGATGSVVTTRNYYGYYQKARIGAPATPSAALISWNGVYSFVHAAYEALTDLERNEWLASAQNPVWQRIDALAAKQSFSGFHLFMHLNLSLALIGSALLSTPPLYPVRPPLMPPIATNYATVAEVIVTWPPFIGQTVILYASNAMNVGRMSNNQIFGFMQKVDSHAGGIDFTAPWNARYGAITSGKKIFVRVSVIDPITGVRSLPQYASGITA